MAVFGDARRDADPALADAIFLDVGFFGPVKADADIALQGFFVVEGALGSMQRRSGSVSVMGKP